MAEIDDLKAGMAALTTAVADVSTELSGVAAALNALKGQQTINPADVEAAAQQANALAGSLEAAVQAAKTSTGV